LQRTGARQENRRQSSTGAEQDNDKEQQGRNRSSLPNCRLVNALPVLATEDMLCSLVIFILCNRVGLTKRYRATALASDVVGFNLRNSTPGAQIGGGGDDLTHFSMRTVAHVAPRENSC
jgi:hypothetical protein